VDFLLGNLQHNYMEFEIRVGGEFSETMPPSLKDGLEPPSLKDGLEPPSLKDGLELSRVP
jgi:hypothetical protein